MMNQEIIIFGEVLYDRLPDGKMILGGAPFNVAWHLQAFGVSPLLISRVGNDSHGEMIKSAMINWGMNTEGIQEDAHHPTGIVEVKFIENEPHYDIVNNSAYDFIESGYLPALPTNAILYHGTLALRNPQARATFEKIKKDVSPSIFFDVNLREPWWSLSDIKSLLQDTSSLKLNEQELSLIVKEGNNTQDKVNYLFSHYPLQNIIVTQGKAGATYFTNNGIKQNITPSQNISVVDVVGAGDAFCSVLLLGMLKKWDIPTTLTRAQEFACKIVGIRGATTSDKSFYGV
jgi:fructokinase